MDVQKCGDDGTDSVIAVDSLEIKPPLNIFGSIGSITD